MVADLHSLERNATATITSDPRGIPITRPEDIAPTPALPVVPKEISAEWLSQVLKRKIQSVTLEKIIPGTATKVLITVTYEDQQASKD